MGLPKLGKGAIKKMTDNLGEQGQEMAQILMDINKNQLSIEKNNITIQKNQVDQEKYLIAICNKLGITDEDIEKL